MPTPPRSAPPSFPRESQTVIIGGGVIGASIAFHLAEAGITDILVLDENELGSGSSGKPIGGVRAQFSDPTNIELGLRSLDAYRRFSTRPGADIQFSEVGYLFLLTDDAQAATFEQTLQIQREYRVPARMLTPSEVHDACPYIPADSVVAGTFSSIDGHALPGRAVAGYAAAAAALGVRFLTDTPVTGVDVDSGEITGVRTPWGTVRTHTVICAAGAWSAGIGSMVGVELPIVPLKRQLAFTRPGAVAQKPIPFTLDFSTTAYFHNAGPDALLLGWADPEQEPGFEREYSDEWLDGFRAFARLRAPELADVGVERGWAGLYEMTPDKNALIGEATDVSRFLYASGFSGHGFLQAPAVGEVVRDLVLGRRPYLDITRFSAARFSPGAAGLLAEINVI